MIEHLRRIGLSDLEARCYLTLHEESHLSGYEVAKRVSVSRTNVYAALRALVDKGGCRIIDGDPVLYDAVPINQFAQLLKSEFEDTIHVLSTELTTRPQHAPGFYSWNGADSVTQAIRRLVVNATQTIVVDAWAEDLPQVEGLLLDAQSRGITVVVITLGEWNTDLDNLIQHMRYDIPPSTPRKFTLLCDSRSSIIANFGGQMRPSALETEHPAVADVLKNAFYHDVIMHNIEGDFGSELTGRYGEQYANLRGFYEQKGWTFK
ncbi:TrmB family transcriptional regulator [Alicyclobacillus sp. ALC3]|uniref:TrmB family transcriptional regulator n=1 Tax=Alicyclobacillus sp. ALC3 TaxID=2796143 RepID=UPI002378CBEA|nr:TrmB family transcriptional regulator [Alicyclobacillus sp. ALC3]WDL98436.1 TrmB family transcriptional regulator [Alicyclobacillus sp. ALC3]